MSAARPSSRPAGLGAAAPALLALAAALASCGDSPGGGLVCNGHAELCDRRFDQVAFPGTHNSMSNQDESWLVPNQIHGLTRQLEDGIRVFLIDTHYDGGATYLCHELCELGKIPLVDALTKFRVFLDAHPAEVITFVIENGISNADTEAAFVAADLVKYTYVHPAGESWPTLRELIRRGTRLLVMAETGHPPPAWYQYAYDLSWDTPYSFASPADFSCALNRGVKSNPLFQINHWLSTPLSLPQNAEEVNPFAVLWPRVEQCRREAGRIPNFIAVDFYSIGDLFRVVDRLNGF